MLLLTTTKITEIDKNVTSTKYNIQKTSANNNSLNINLLLQILTINILTVQSVFLILNFYLCIKFQIFI